MDDQSPSWEQEMKQKWETEDQRKIEGKSKEKARGEGGNSNCAKDRWEEVFKRVNIFWRRNNDTYNRKGEKVRIRERRRGREAASKKIMIKYNSKIDFNDNQIEIMFY